MAETAYRKDSTALLFVDPYDDFLSEGGKVWPLIKARPRREFGPHPGPPPSKRRPIKSDRPAGGGGRKGAGEESSGRQRGKRLTAAACPT